MNQLIANVSSVPSVRQLTAFRIERACVSAPSNVLTRAASCSDDDSTDNAHGRVSSSQNYGMVRLRQDLNFALQQSTNCLKELVNPMSQGYRAIAMQN
jgi:hypothetical protein